MFFRCFPFPSTEDIILFESIEAKSIKFGGPYPQRGTKSILNIHFC